jgi:hypothetical protein
LNRQEAIDKGSVFSKSRTPRKKKGRIIEPRNEGQEGREEEGKNY